MYYCETSGRVCFRLSLPNRIKAPLQSKLRRMIALLKLMLTPHDSSLPPAMVTDKTLNSWLGPIKTFFWVTNAIAFGIVLANVCN